jgi:hypothetical protein
VTEIPDVYQRRRKVVQKVREQIEQENDGEFDFPDMPDSAAADSPIEEAFDTYNAMSYFIYTSALPPPDPKKSSTIPNLPKMCFVHQLYSVLPDNTAVDRELVSKKPFPLGIH